MMKHLTTFLTTLVVCIVITACSDYTNTVYETDTNSDMVSYKVSPQEAETVLDNFLSCCGTRGVSDRHISGIYAIRSNSPKYTRATTENDLKAYDTNIDTLIYAINFKEDKGFALVAADKRTEPILAIIDEGNFSIDSLKGDRDADFLSFVGNAIDMEINDIKKYHDNTNTRTLVVPEGYNTAVVYPPLLHTKWGQGSTYGLYCPNGIAGCAVIATAQILSYYQTINHVDWTANGTSGGADLHWGQIISDCDKYNGSLTNTACLTSGNEIAQLNRYLGIALNAKYKSGETSVGESNAIDWLNKYGGVKASKLRDYDEQRIVAVVTMGRNLVYARGNASKNKVLGIQIGWNDGHAWVYDGAISATRNGKAITLMHCNWGWYGNKNGYYISRAFNTKTGATIYDSNDNQSGEKDYKDYKYHLQYSEISK